MCEKAIECYDEAIKLNSKYPEAWFNKGLALHNVKMHECAKAADCYYKALESDPKSIRIKANLAEGLLLSDKVKPAEDLAKEVLHQTDDQVYGFVMRFLIVISLYLQDLNEEGKSSAIDLMKFSQSFPTSFKMTWLFDGLRNKIKKSDALSDNVKDMLFIVLDLPSLGTMEERLEMQERAIDLMTGSEVVDKIRSGLRTVFRKEDDLPSDMDIVIRNNSSPDHNNEGWYHWEVFIDATDSTLSKIRRVKYILHPSFADRIKMVDKPEGGFRLKGYGWGEFSIKVEIEFDKSTIEKYHWLELIGPKPLDR